MEHEVLTSDEVRRLAEILPKLEKVVDEREKMRWLTQSLRIIAIWIGVVLGAGYALYAFLRDAVRTLGGHCIMNGRLIPMNLVGFIVAAGLFGIALGPQLESMLFPILDGATDLPTASTFPIPSSQMFTGLGAGSMRAYSGRSTSASTRMRPS